MYQNGLTTSDRLTSEFVRLVLVAVVCFIQLFELKLLDFRRKGRLRSLRYKTFRYKLTQSRFKIVSHAKRKKRRIIAVVCFYTAFSIEVVGLHAKGKTSRVYRSFRYKLI